MCLGTSNILKCHPPSEMLIMYLILYFIEQEEELNNRMSLLPGTGCSLKLSVYLHSVKF